MRAKGFSKTNGLKCFRSRTAWLVCGALLSLALSGTAQPVSLGLQRSNNQVSVFWPNGLSLVQPQKATNLTLSSWQDLGAATTATNVAEAIGSGPAFYRLRFLKPVITMQPDSLTNSLGSNVTFSVAATGTAPLAYQWRKESTNLVGQTAASLGLTNLIASDAGSYSVAITNRAGSVTSSVAVLTVIVPSARPVGIYMGTFASQTDNGGFAVMLRSNGLAYVVGYNTPQAEGVFASDFPVADDGTFSTTTAQGGTMTGTFTATGVSGNFTNASNIPGSFSGDRKDDTGIHSADVGYYTGTYSGAFNGNGYAIVAADGAVYFYIKGSSADGGAFSVIDGNNNFSGTIAAGNIQVSGTLDPTTHVISGTYSYSGTPLGTFTLTRSLTL